MTQLPSPDQSFAILIGTDNYDSTALSDIPSITANLEDLADVLTSPTSGGFLPQHCVTLSNPATPQEVSQTLRQHADKATDTLLVYIAGHGIPESHGGELYLALTKTNIDDLDFTALRYEALRKLFLRKEFAAKNRIIILDCCFAGRAGQEFPALAAEGLRGMIDIEGVYILAATGRNHEAIAPRNKRNTAFTEELLGVLKNGIPGGSELLTLDAIYHAVWQRMRTTGRPLPEAFTTKTAAHLALARNMAYGQPPDPPIHGARLAIDFGTSNTAAVLRLPDGTLKTLLFDDSPLLPSAIYARPEGDFASGRDAYSLAQSHPQCLEPYPKKRIAEDQVLLGTREIDVVELVATVLRRVAQEATAAAGAAPAELVMTHPAEWASARRQTLEAAAQQAGLPPPRLLSEPVAATAYFVDNIRRVPAGKYQIIFDFGAGTFDASIIRSAENGEIVILATEGISDLGGLDIDQVIVTHLENTLNDSRFSQRWRRLKNPTTEADRRARWQLWENARLAKEQLSRMSTTRIHVPLIEQNVDLSLAEFERLALPILKRTVAVTWRVREATKTRIRGLDLDGIFLVGGSSRIPLVKTLLHTKFDIDPVLRQPELVVAEGAASYRFPGPVSPTPPVSSPPPPIHPSEGSPNVDTRPVPTNTWVSRVGRQLWDPSWAIVSIVLGLASAIATYLFTSVALAVVAGIALSGIAYVVQPLTAAALTEHHDPTHINGKEGQ